MSKEYIGREVILEQIAELKDNFSPTVRPMFDVFKHITTEAPAADVEPVRHGRWLDENSFDAHYQPIYRCSECNKTVADNYISCHKYCLHCGSRMDGDKTSPSFETQRSEEEVGNTLKTLHNEMFENDNSRCHKCARELYCSVRRDYDHSCPSYVRDPKDGGFYG